MAEIGSIIAGKYEVLHLVGEGGMSRVYLAMDTTLNKQWALKEIKKSDDPDQARILLDSVIHEANLIKGLDHPAFPRIVDMVESGGETYIVMDYIEGVSLETIVAERGPQPQEDVVDWGIQICDALDCLHTQKPPVIYRDMKPANVILRPDGSIRIIDFGIARFYREDKAGAAKAGDTEPLGTRGYAAPEQFGGLGQTDARTDVYCLGATLHRLLTGKNPAEPPYEIAPLRQIDPSLSGGLEAVVAKATHRDRDARYQSCAEMRYALENYGHEDEAWRRGQKGILRRFAVLCALACLLLVSGVCCLAARSMFIEGDYTAQIELASSSSLTQEKEEHLSQAARLKPVDTRAWEGLIAAYKQDGTFTSEEESQYLSLLLPVLGQIEGNQEVFSTVSFETGKLYWYYYNYASAAGSAGSSASRLAASAQWFEAPAADDSFEQHELAAVYRDIARFNAQIVTRVDEGSDTGLYAPLSAQLFQLLDAAGSDENKLMRLEASRIVCDCVEGYARKFKADGVSREDLDALLERSAALANATESDSARLDQLKTIAQEHAATAMHAVAVAYETHG